jgi:Leucine-rich repeat (LRR) protein
VFLNPEAISELKNLKSLSLVGTKLKTIPDDFRNLKKLRYLDLSNNAIETLPKWIGELTSLRELLLKNNMLRVIPRSVGNLKNLEFVDLVDNRISNLILALSLTYNKSKVIYNFSRRNDTLFNRTKISFPKIYANFQKD